MNASNPNLDRLHEWSGPAHACPDALATVVRSRDDTPWYVAWIECEAEPYVLFRYRWAEGHFPAGYEGRPLRAALEAHPPARYQEVTRLLTLFRWSVEQGEASLPAFEPDALLDAMLADTRGYILYEYQLMHVLQQCFPNAMSSFLSRALRMSLATAWDVVDATEMRAGTSLGGVLRARWLPSIHQHVPPYAEALALWNLLRGEPVEPR